MGLSPLSARWRFELVWTRQATLPDPAAMAAGVTGSLVSFEQLFDAVMGGGCAMAARLLGHYCPRV
jgi:hypothetical protein